MAHVQKRQPRMEKETIHSGHFMVSHFEAEAQDDFDDLAVPVPDEEQNVQKVTTVATYTVPVSVKPFQPADKQDIKHHQQLSIEISLTKLFKCMTLAYRQKLTSPKWNRFKGIKLRWKDKIRLNNVIWRCWHMQFIKRQNTLVCQFASPLDVDTHVKPETTILEGKYWKRRAEAVIAEYKKWRMFHIMRLLGKGDTSGQDTISDMDTVESISQDSDLAGTMLTDEDYLNFMSDTLFSTISSHQPFAFPDPREIARGANLADFIQPSLGPLQPNLDDFMDTLEPLHDLLSTSRLPPVPEESPIQADDNMYRNEMTVDTYSSQGFITGQNTATMPTNQINLHATNNTQMMSMQDQSIKSKQIQMYDNGRMYPQQDLQNNVLNTHDMMNTYTSTYEQSTSQANPQASANVYTDKSRMYVNPPKIITTPDTSYKYNTVIPPSQTAPETVSLLQQPVPNQKYTSNVLIRSGYRDKSRQRMGHYSNQMSSSHYQYNQPMQSQPAPISQQNFDNRQQVTRQAPTLQYVQLSPLDQYKGKTSSRAFKLPSPPLAPAGPQQVSNISPSSSGLSRKEQFRSQSLPLGAQLNADWSVSAPARALPVPPPAPPAPAPVDASIPRLTGRTREASTGAIRIRSRSSSGGGGPAEPARARPVLTSVASEPALPQASVMLAQLLSKQHSQSLYRLGSSEDVAGVEPKSPVKRAQPSPIGSDVMSPHQSLSPPASPPSPACGEPREARRTHMHAEQKRRYNIKNGFDTLQSLIPHLSTNPAGKVSKAAMLQKGADYIKQLKAERNQIKEEMDSLRAQIECLNNSISNCHSLLPATGAPVGRARGSRLREMFARHVASRTAHNWKYWLLSVVCAALVDSFSSCVAHTSRGDLVRTTLLWAEQHCSLVEMRPAVLNSLRVLCTTTDILSSPERLPDEARAAVASHALKTEPA